MPKRHLTDLNGTISGKYQIIWDLAHTIYYINILYATQGLWSHQVILVPHIFRSLEARIRDAHCLPCYLSYLWSLQLKQYASTIHHISLYADDIHLFIRTNLGKWMSKSISFDGRISILKMMVLSLIGFLSSLFPLNPSIGYWDKLNNLIGMFIWNNKRKMIITTLQRKKSAGGWGVPNFKIYHWSFVLCIIKSWLDSSGPASWRFLEEGLVYPADYRI